MNALPFFDRTGDAEHARPTVPYWRGMSLDEIERHAHTCGDTATLALIDLISDACGTRRSEAIERAVAMRASVQEAADAEARIADLVKTNTELRHKLDAADRLLRAVYFVLKPWNPQPSNRSAPPPKWAQHLLGVLSVIRRLHA